MHLTGVKAIQEHIWYHSMYFHELLTDILIYYCRLSRYTTRILEIQPFVAPLPTFLRPVAGIKIEINSVCA